MTSLVGGFRTTRPSSKFSNSSCDSISCRDSSSTRDFSIQSDRTSMACSDNFTLNSSSLIFDFLLRLFLYILQLLNSFLHLLRLNLQNTVQFDIFYSLLLDYKQKKMIAKKYSLYLAKAI